MASSKPVAHYLSAYPPHLVSQVQQAIVEGKFGALLMRRYPETHDIRTDRALYDFVAEYKSRYLRNAEQLSKVVFDSTLHPIRNALGMHTAISRVQGAKLKAKREIRVATLFRAVPPEFLQMIVVHELAHIKERDHDKAFYQLCTYMEPDYHQYEFDLRAYLTYRDAGGAPLWDAGAE